MSTKRQVRKRYTRHVSCAIKPQMYEDLEEEADRQGENISEIMRKAIQEYLDKHGE